MEELKNIQCPKSGFDSEASFTTWWLGELKKKGFWKKKWSDASYDLKPYDCNIATTSGDYYVEIKRIIKDDFNISIFRPNQIEALDHLTRLGRNAIVCIYNAKQNKYAIISWENLKKVLQTEKK